MRFLRFNNTLINFSHVYVVSRRGNAVNVKIMGANPYEFKFADDDVAQAKFEEVAKVLQDAPAVTKPEEAQAPVPEASADSAPADDTPKRHCGRVLVVDLLTGYRKTFNSRKEMCEHYGWPSGSDVTTCARTGKSYQNRYSINYLPK